MLKEIIPMHKTRFTNLDLLKFVASLCIALHHYQQAFVVKYENGLNFYGGNIPFGYLVELFFIISGFLVAKSVYRDTFVKNVRKRWLRLFPYAFIATLTAYVVFVIYNAVIGSPLLDRSYSAPNVAASLLMVHQGWITEFIGVNNPTWYLCVLMWLYIVYYLINSVGNLIEKKYRTGFLFRVIAYSGFILLGIGIRILKLDLPFLHSSNGRGYTAFFLGVLMIYLIEKTDKKYQIIIGAVMFSAGIIAVALQIQLALSLTFMLFPGLLLVILNIKQASFKYVSNLGDISFEIFIWHMPVYYLVYLIISVSNIDILDNYLVILLTLAIVICVSIIMHYCVNMPIYRRVNNYISPSKISNSISPK